MSQPPTTHLYPTKVDLKHPVGIELVRDPLSQTAFSGAEFETSSAIINQTSSAPTIE